MDFAAHTVALYRRIRETAPLVHNITNFVVMNSSANILLAAGASPVMAHALDEVAEMASLAGALVLNIGTLEQDWVAAMIRAAQAANRKGIPVILDPVGAGATRFRTATAQRIMAEATVAVVRGNASEVLALVSADARTRGVDAAHAVSDEIVAAARTLAREKGCIVAVSGAEDLITDGARILRVANGHPLLTRVTGTGCGLSAVTGAFCAVAAGALLEAAVAAFAYYGLCAELAARTADKPGSFFVAFLDALYAARDEDIVALLKVREG